MRLKIIRNFLMRIRGFDSLDTLIKNGLEVGKNFNMQPGCIIDPSHCWLIKIGNNVTLARNVYLLAHDASTKFTLGYTKIGKISIGDNVFVGTGVIIMPNVNVGENVIIGAGSVVTKDIPNNSVVIGSPAKRIYSYDEYINRNKELMKKVPVFDESYTLRCKVTSQMRKNMIQKLDNTIGFVE
jgi:maltose O-acetyltransferase